MNLAEHWQAERTARATRAAAAIAAGRATGAQAERDAHLCTLVTHAIASDFAVPSLDMDSSTVNDYADAADLLTAIARKHRLDCAAVNPTPPEAWRQRQAMILLAQRTAIPVAYVLGVCWHALHTTQSTTATPCPPMPHGWRLPILQAAAA